MFSPFAPLSVHLFCLVGGFTFCALFIGTGLALSHQSRTNYSPSDYEVARMAGSLGWFLIACFGLGAYLILSRNDVFAQWPFFAPGYLLAIFLMVTHPFLPHNNPLKTFMFQALFVLAGVAGLLWQLPDDVLVFKGALPFLFDRLLAGMALLSIVFLFDQIEKTDRGGVPAWIILALAIIILPLGISGVQFICITFLPSLDLPALMPVWPPAWYGIGLLALGTGFGVLYWTGQGYDLFLDQKARLAIGFLFAYLVMKITLVSSPFVAVTLLLFYVGAYGLPPLTGRTFALSGHRALLKLVSLHIGFFCLACLAYFWPLLALGLGLVLCLVLLFALSQRSFKT